MRYGFITCVRLGEACIEELVSLQADLVFLGTLDDAKARAKSGRVYLDGLAEEHGIPLVKFANVNDPSTVQTLLEARLDWLFIVGWSQIAKKPVLNVPRLGVIGMHPTLLPVGRGRAAIPWAIIKGLNETGVTMFKLDEGMDTGPVLGQRRVPIVENETSTTLYEKIIYAHRELIKGTFPALQSGDPALHIQDESRATVWPGRTPADGRLDLSVVTAAEVDRHVRALTHPYPGAFIEEPDGRVMRIWSGHPVCESDEPAPSGQVLHTADGTRYLATAIDYA